MKFLQELYQLTETCTDCEIVYVDEQDTLLTESAQRAYKRQGKKVVKKFRCTSGHKKGKIVSDPKICMMRADPKKKRVGTKVGRTRKGIRIMKSKITRKTSVAKMVRKMNKRISGRK